MSAKANNGRQQLTIPAAIRMSAKFLGRISPKLLTAFAARLFSTPIKHKIPKREHDMDRLSHQQKLYVGAINKSVVVYQYGSGPKKILLAHGWSGRGTQLVKIADALRAEGYALVSFDAPAHGKSAGSTTLMPEFVAVILEIQKQFGPFEAAVGHSLGGMSLLNAAKSGFDVARMVIIGSGDKVTDIIDDFIGKLGINASYNKRLRDHFEKKSSETMESFSAYIAAQMLTIPVLVIHDRDDYEVPVGAAIHIHQHLKNGELMLTSGLGHRKILGDKATILKICSFISGPTYEKFTAYNYSGLLSGIVPGTTASQN